MLVLMAAAQNEYIQHLVDQLQLIGPVSSRRMFGGHGLFLEGLMFGLVSSDVLFLKVDEVNRPDFERQSLAAFSYKRKGKLCTLSYYEAPESAMDDVEELCLWANNAFSAALRAAAAKNNKSRRAGNSAR